ncbi:MAG: ribosome small subunit-dependent GTPase A [Microscillaceae bacterium]|nr:ribosome small subunit-dependent GTPase A [Microscillaceae bacterium]MDW8460243.1 ribosome small subunit-dependent GTPase A [Cytophagales bacterium]
MQGLVMRTTGSWYDVLAENQEIIKCRLRGKTKLQDLKVTNPIAVGDVVTFEPEPYNPKQGVITAIAPRENYIIRQSVHKKGHGHIIAANIDQAVLMVTLAMPRTSLGFIDRFLVSAEAFRIPTVLVFNKLDLLDEELLNYQQLLKNLYESLGYPCIFTSVLTKQGIEQFEQMLTGKKTLLSGHSGVGKSSLINAIAPHLNLKTREVSTFANKGVHTTTFATMYQLQTNTFLIDTPGIKELGLIDMEQWEISHYFPEMRKLLNQCRYHNCLHLNEPQCRVLEAVEQGNIALSRYESYLSMLQNEDSYR